MCGVTLGPQLPDFRRSRSLKDLSQAAELLNGSGLPRATKSYADLGVAALLDNEQLAAELATLRIEEASAHGGTQSSDDTGRSSPTSGYEQLLRSRSPSAVLYVQEDPSVHGGSEDALSSSSKPQQQAVQPAAPAAAGVQSQPPLLPGGDSLQVLPSDTPFLESAASFSIVEVPMASTSTSPRCVPGHPERPGSPCTCGPHSAVAAAIGAATSSSTSSDAAAAATAGAKAPVFVPANASAASEADYNSSSAASASAASSAAASAASSFSSVPPSPFAPFARVAVPRSLISQPPSLLSMGSGTSPGFVAGDSSSSSPSGALSGSLAGAASIGGAGNECTATRRGSLDGWGTSLHLSEGHAAEELFYRLNHARQTVEFVKRQATACSALNKAAMGVWEALELLNTLREYESALLGDADATPEMPLLEHALQCAEACRAAFPDEDYMHLAGLLAPLGKLLAHAKFGAEPQWAICGETFPVGCRFHPAIRHSQYFSANPDRRKRLYSSPTGVYREGCGLGSVLMSWGAGEYLHLVLRLNRVAMPPEALFCIRHQKLQCVFRQGCPYSELLSEFDRVQLPRLAKFQQLCTYRRQPRADPLMVPLPGSMPGGAAGSPGTAVAVGGVVEEEEVVVPMQVNPSLKRYYDGLLQKYIPQGVLLW